jgi:hypothetical protein
MHATKFAFITNPDSLFKGEFNIKSKGIAVVILISTTDGENIESIIAIITEPSLWDEVFRICKSSEIGESVIVRFAFAKT